MACTTILVGKNASYDGSTIVARNEDSPNGQFEPKKMQVVHPEDQPKTYTSVLSHVTFELPDNPMRYSSVPDALSGHGIWAAAGFNTANVGMSATETITSNERVLGADPLVEYVPAKGVEGEEGYVPAIPGGLGEEDFVTVVLPYVRTAREGVQRLGALLEQYGTYEMNGIAFSDEDEIWWLETIGGHHWIAKRVPDDAYVTMPNQLGIDYFDLLDAEGEQVEHMASPDLRQWMAENHLNLTNTSRLEPEDILDEEFFDDDLDDMDEEEADAYEEYMADLMDLIADVREGMLSGEIFNPREAFGSHSDSDHVYNTPRAWYMQRCLNPHDGWDGEDAAFGPEDDDIPWSRVPERKVTIEDVKYVLSAHYQGTAFDCYGSKGTAASRNAYRPIGINRNSQLAVLQIRPYVPEPLRCIQWMAFGSNVFNALVGLYANVDAFPEYLSNTTDRVTTENFYWANRVIAALADARFHETGAKVESYQEKIGALGHKMLRETDRAVAGLAEADIPAALAKANDDLCAELKDQTEKLLASVLYTTSCAMRNGFAMSDNER
ncbi:C69 family dipeptidase [Collinsella stercoris]|uniref:Dipeptidase n=1 Tax=Collinsella stercoris DSM 13279 TaxID=445975 RepID=B6GE61_9ACTN|nr:C69 family dipeptidase [Collinsella stercoris]EEA89444.1 peptidase, C69 family [Collinsella stercoris DSM 13279]UEA45783.1 C69 family dipeptidase [Collinsella stercoris DSM 13279]UWP11695.1 C69 family dipeptidase [Collinsella stercoris]